MNIKKLTNDDFEAVVVEATEIVHSGGIVAAPFDTVYGFLCDPRNDNALKKIFELKKRSLDKTIGLVTTSLRGIEPIAFIKHEDFIRSHAYGPYTLVLPTKNAGLSKYCVKDNTVAVRIPNSELILHITQASGHVLAQTSANLSGSPTCNTVEELKEQFSISDLNKIDLIINGPILNKAPSQIFDLTGDEPREIAR